MATPAAAAVRAAALPADVRDGLAFYSVAVGPPLDAPSVLPVSAAQAKRIVKRHFGGSRRTKVGIYLVRITAHPGPFDPLAAGHGWTTIAPLGVGDLAWVGVIRGASFPLTGPPGTPSGSYQATLAVLVQTTEPKWVVGMSIAAARGA